MTMHLPSTLSSIPPSILYPFFPPSSHSHTHTPTSTHPLLNLNLLIHPSPFLLPIPPTPSKPLSPHLPSMLTPSNPPPPDPALPLYPAIHHPPSVLTGKDTDLLLNVSDPSPDKMSQFAMQNGSGVLGDQKAMHDLKHFEMDKHTDLIFIFIYILQFFLSMSFKRGFINEQCVR